MILYISYIQDLTKVVIFDSWKPIATGGYSLSTYAENDTRLYFDIPNSTVYKQIENIDTDLADKIKDKASDIGYTVYDKTSFENKINNLQNG